MTKTNTIDSMAWRPRIKDAKEQLMWNRFQKKGGRGVYSKKVVRITHTGKNNLTYNLILNRRLKRLYGDYNFVELYFSEGYLGVKFLTEETDNSYRISRGTKRNDQISATVVLRNIQPREYDELELEFDTKNKILVIPVSLLSAYTEDNFDFKTFENSRILGKRVHISKISSEDIGDNGE